MEQPRATCPRCDYDLAGLIATWTESCPLCSICSECGLEFDCARVLSPKLMGPLWSFEHSHAPSTRRCLQTAYNSLSPRRFFQQLKVDHRIRIDRLLRFALLWLLIAHLLAFAAAFGSAWISGDIASPWAARPSPRFGFSSQREFWTSLSKALLFPYSWRMSIRTGTSSYLRAPLGPIFLVTFAPLLLMPAWMLILSTSMQQARVRKAHLLRGLCLSIPGGLAFALVALGAISIAAALRRILNIDPGLVAVTVMLVWFAYHMNWWFVFIRNYLRLRHAPAVVILNSIMTGLLLVLIVVVSSLMHLRF